MIRTWKYNPLSVLDHLVIYLLSHYKYVSTVLGAENSVVASWCVKNLRSPRIEIKRDH